MCLQSLCSILPCDLSIQFFVKWYTARNAPGPQDLTVNQEWNLFLVIFFTMFGYEVNKLNIYLFNDLNKLSESCSPVIVSKKQKTINNGSVDDWTYLLSTETTSYTRVFLSDAIGLRRLSEDSKQFSTINIKSEKNLSNKISIPSTFITHLPNILLSFHLLYEDNKLKINMSESLLLLAKLLHRLSVDLNLPSFTDYYFSDFPVLSKNVNEFQIHCINVQRITLPKFFPVKVPNVFKSLYKLLLSSDNLSYMHQCDINEISQKLMQLFSKFNKDYTYNTLEIDLIFKKIIYCHKHNENIKKNDNELIENIVMHSYKTGKYT